MASSDESGPPSHVPDVEATVEPGVLREKVNLLNLSTVSVTSCNKPGYMNNMISQFQEHVIPAVEDLINNSTLSDESINIFSMATQTSSSELCISTPSAKRRRDVFPKPVVSLPAILPNERSFHIANRSKNVTFTFQEAVKDTSQAAATSATAMEEEDSDDDENLRPVTTHRIATESTQTFDHRPDDVVIHPKALPIWLLSKKHRSYEQRATLRARLMTSCLKTSITPRWALRKDQEPRPQYITNTPAMLLLQKRHALEITEQARNDLLARASEEGQRADDYLSITHQIYAKENDSNSFKAEARIVEIMTRYKLQERKKLDAAFLKDKENYPCTSEEWEKTYFDSAQPSTSKRRRSRSSRSASREKKRAGATRGARPNSPKVSNNHQNSARTTSKDSSSYSGKGKAGPGSSVKGSSKRPEQSSSSSTSSYDAPNRSSDDTRNQRGRGTSRGRGRGRGGNQDNRSRDRCEITHEERSLFDKMKEFMSKHK